MQRLIWREYMKRCIIISSSPDIEISFLKENINSSDFIICADGGYKYAYQAELVPNIIIGDFDSAELPRNCPAEIMWLPIKKDDTDTFYCVKEALRRGFDDILIFGGTGGRIDHTYANISVLCYINSYGAKGTLIDTKNSVTILSNEELRIEGRVGEIFSIFAFGCDKCMVTLEGFEYTLNNGILFANEPIGISNVITEDSARVVVSDGTAVVIFSKD